MTVVTLGPEGTYSHRAAQAVDDDIDFRQSVTAIVDAVASGEYDRGIIPIENSIEGSVTESLDAIAEYEIAIVSEIVTPINHALLAQSDDFDTIASHSQALAQCRSYLESTYPDATLEAVASTAQSVEYAREDPSVAGVAHPDNAGDGIEVIADDIQEQSSNATRFFAVAPAADRSPGGGKTSIVAYPDVDYPGLLLELLEPFANRNINLTRLESRPSGERLGDYVFHIDIEAGLYESRTEEALADLEELAENGWVRRLGSYDTQHVVE
ncbi:prephenate dehydratase [Halostagnicola sp. A-GB9-2]|uniref:prephenate dehydratase n=1 Tax=Halostagnicola sp. A-GB9-2 TaxID=3048066 RepID=UPI0024C00515|nr:prephenate dehydratase [Halostagnicola sp. A-GB9-2]MDJ1432707.1 prephenate dehydratase [Halostagnicola sp. A-GB9-2]